MANVLKHCHDGTFSRDDSTIRLASFDDMPAINTIIEQAVMAWPMAGRVKRLSLPLLRYQLGDTADFEFLLYEIAGHATGVAAWNATNPLRTRDGRLASLLHGLYIEPAWQREGIGRALQASVCDRAQCRGIEKLVVKAERISVPYFERCGYERVPAQTLACSQYPHLFWRSTVYV